MHFRDMQEQGTFHAGREYERKISTKQIKEFKNGGYIRHKHNCFMGEYNSILIGKGCDCGLSKLLKGE